MFLTVWETHFFIWSFFWKEGVVNKESPHNLTHIFFWMCWAFSPVLILSLLCKTVGFQLVQKWWADLIHSESGDFFRAGWWRIADRGRPRYWTLNLPSFNWKVFAHRRGINDVHQKNPPGDFPQKTSKKTSCHSLQQGFGTWTREFSKKQTMKSVLVSWLLCWFLEICLVPPKCWFFMIIKVSLTSRSSTEDVKSETDGYMSIYVSRSASSR